MAGQAEKAGGARWRRVLWGGAALLWLMPLVAMLVTDEMNWDETDFIVFGAMLAAACGAYELATRMTGSAAYRIGAGVAIVAAFLLVWINLAVGIIGSEDNPANLMFGGVLLVGIVGAALARLQPPGMARVLVAMALTQVVAAAVALAFGWGSDWENWPRVIVVINGFLAALWLVSALLFRRAARENGPSAVAP